MLHSYYACKIKVMYIILNARKTSRPYRLPISYPRTVCLPSRAYVLDVSIRTDYNCTFTYSMNKCMINIMT